MSNWRNCKHYKLLTSQIEYAYNMRPKPKHPFCYFKEWALIEIIAKFLAGIK